MKKILIIQTAFIGDVILATPLVENLHQEYPEADIHFLVRKGNESLLENNPFIGRVLTWDKRNAKYRSLFQLRKNIRLEKYNAVINCQRFFSTGFLVLFSGAKIKSGFSANPLSFSYTIKKKHTLNNGLHEVDRNNTLIEDFSGTLIRRPSLFPSSDDFEKISSMTGRPFICIAPASVWFTKQLPLSKWSELISIYKKTHCIYLLGSKSDFSLCESLAGLHNDSEIVNLAGKLSFLESAALMKKAAMNFANDSAPLHIASAMNAPCTAVFCSTVPEFGFGPLSDNSKILQVSEKLNCRPCGIHGKESCPEKHFNCAMKIEFKDVL